MLMELDTQDYPAIGSAEWSKMVQGLLSDIRRAARENVEGWERLGADIDAFAADRLGVDMVDDGLDFEIEIDLEIE